MTVDDIRLAITEFFEAREAYWQYSKKHCGRDCGCESRDPDDWTAPCNVCLVEEQLAQKYRTSELALKSLSK